MISIEDQLQGIEQQLLQIKQELIAVDRSGGPEGRITGSNAHDRFAQLCIADAGYRQALASLHLHQLLTRAIDEGFDDLDIMDGLK